jgi:hypothetical protein
MTTAVDVSKSFDGAKTSENTVKTNNMSTNIRSIIEFQFAVDFEGLVDVGSLNDLLAELNSSHNLIERLFQETLVQTRFAFRMRRQEIKENKLN